MLLLPIYFLYSLINFIAIMEVNTIEDYYALPEERRAELIDGVIYDMGAPSTLHQMIVLSLCYTIQNQIHGRGGKCRVFVSPLDVQLDSDNWTMVQPDMFILCDPNKLTDRCVVGAPDFVAEVLSPSTRAKDYILKLRKYKEEGVREYWIIDPEKERVLVYHFEREEQPREYRFKDSIPIGVYGGEMAVNFQEIKKELI